VVTVADGSKIDFESSAGHAYTVTVQSSDGTLTSSQAFTINVGDVAMTTPVDSNSAANSVAEGAAAGTAVGITAQASDPSGPAPTYSLIGDTSGGGFTINASTGVVTVANPAKIDFESTAPGHTYNITVQASNGVQTTSQVLAVGVTDGAPSAPIDANGGGNSVTEGAAVGTVVGVTASSTDVNGGVLTYSLIGDSSGGGFTINSSTGVITVANSAKIDYETAPGQAYTVTAQASDGTLSNSQTFTIGVTDVAPTAPVDANGATNTIAEGAANGSAVGVTASSTDINGPAVTYSLVGDTSGGGFTINATTGVITVANSTKIDYETAAGHAYTVTAQASDGTLTNSQTFTIAVTDVAPSASADVNGATNTIAEGAANGSAVGVTASSTDINGPAVTYSLVGDTSGGGFTINSTTGVVTVANSTKIDYETAAGHAHTVTAQASDGTLSSSQSFTIAVTDVAPSASADVNGATNTIAEGAANGSAVGITASSTDPNGPATTYSLTDSAGGKFAINSSTGVVTVANGAAIDFETAPGPGHSYSITVQGTSGALSTTQAFSIGVTDVGPSAPADTDTATNSVFEGAANGTAVGLTASSTDPGGGPAPTYSLFDSAGGRFAINSTTGVITVANGAAIDFETAPGHAYGITVQSTASALSSTQNFTIAVGDVAPSAPTDVDGATNTVAEGAANGSTVGVTASSTDVNGPGVTYSLVGDTSGGGFTINSTTGVVTVADSTKLDYETTPTHAYTITAQASDGTLTNSQTFNIALTDVAASAPTDVNDATDTVAEGAANGSSVGITASSADPNGPAPTYSLTDDAGGRFAIDPGTGIVTVANGAAIDFETAVGHAYGITVQAMSGALSTTQNFSIGITDVAPSAPIDNNGNTNSVFEGATNGTAVGITASSADPGGGPAPTFTLTDSAGGRFAINSTTGIVTVANGAAVDFETAPGPGHSYGITVLATAGAQSSTQNFSIGVGNVNEAPTGTDNTVTMLEGDSYTFSVADFGFGDPSDIPQNSPQAVRMSTVPGAGAGTFTNNGVTVNTGDSVLATDIVAGHLVFTPAAHSNGAPEASFTFQVQDNGSTAHGGVDLDQSANTLTINVNAVNDAPVNSVPLATQTVNEEGTLTFSSGTGIAITISDIDVGSGNETVTLSVSGGTLALGSTADLASFTNNAGSITLTGTVANVNAAMDGLTYTGNLDFHGSDTLVVMTIDNGNTGAGGPQTDFDGVAITVNDVADTPSVTDATTNEDTQSAAGLVVSRNATDGPDVGFFKITGITNGTLFQNNGTTAISNGDFIAFAEANAGLKFTPTANFFGDGSFQVQASTTNADAGLGGNVTVATIAVNPVNDAPSLTAHDRDPLYVGSTVQLFDSTSVSVGPANESAQNIKQLVLTVSNVDGTGTTDRLSIDGTDVFLTDGNSQTGTGHGVDIAVALVAGTATVMISKAGDIPVADVASIVNGLTYTNDDVTGGEAARHVTLTSIQDSGGTSPGADTRALSIDSTVTFNQPPVITSDGGGATASKSVAENTTAMTTVTATDADSGPSPLSYSIVGGDDQLKFAIVPSTGVLSFINAPDFENPTDTSTAGNNTYIVTVRASDGVSIDDQTITVTVTNINEQPVAVADSGGTMTEDDAPKTFNVRSNDTLDPDSGAANTVAPGSVTVSSAAAGTSFANTDASAAAVNSSHDIQVTLGTAFQQLHAGETATVTVPYTLTGNSGDTSSANLTVTVSGVNDVPVAADDNGAMTEDESGKTFTVLTGDTFDPDHGAPTAATAGAVTTTGTITNLVAPSGESIDAGDITVTANASNQLVVNLGADFQHMRGGETTTFDVDYSLHGDQAGDTSTGHLHVTVTGVNDAPTANNVTFSGASSANYNTDLVVNDPADGAPTTTGPFKGVAASLLNLSGASDVDGPASPLTFTPLNNVTTTNGGHVTLQADGDFVFTPKVGDTNVSDSFSFTVTDGNSPTAGTVTKTATISFNGPHIWYVNADAAAGGDGSSEHPFNSLADVSGASGPDVAGDIIYVAEAAGDYNGNMTLLANQQLIGSGAALVVGGSTLIAAGSATTLTNTGGDAITLNSGNTVSGFAIGNTSGAGITGSNVGTLTISHMSDTGTGKIIDITGLAGNSASITYDTATTTSSSSEAIKLTGINGAFMATAGAISGVTGTDVLISGGTAAVGIGSSITSVAGGAVEVTGRGAGAGGVTFSGALNVSGGTGISVHDNTAGTTTFSNASKVINTGAGAAVSLATNAGATVNFTNGGLDIDTTSGTGFSATGGGTVNVSGSGNDITATAGQALNLTGVTGSTTFGTIASTGAGQGILISNVDNSTVSITGPTTINDATTDGIRIENSDNSTVTFGGKVTILNDVGAATVADGVDMNANNTPASTINFNGGVDITVNGTGAFGFRATSSGTVNIADPAATSTQITSTNGTALFINPTTLNATLDAITSGGGANGISLTGMSGSLNVGTVSLSGATAAAVAITDTTGTVTLNGGTIVVAGTNAIGVDINDGAADVNIASSVTKTTAGDLVEITGRTGGAITLSGNLSASGTSSGLDIENNTGGTTTFSGGSKTLNTGGTTAVTVVNSAAHSVAFTGTITDIDTTTANAVDVSSGGTLNFNSSTTTINATSGKGLQADGGGTLTVTGNAQVTTTTGVAVDIQNTNIGVNDVTLQSVSANGAISGIVVNTTGTTASSGGLIVTGNGGSTADGSGGTIQNSTGTGISLTNTRDVSFDQMNVTGSGDDGIHGVGVVNFTLNRSNINNNGNSTADDGLQFGEASGTVVGVTGNVSILASSISGNAHTNVHIRDTSGTIDNLTVTGSSFNDLNDTFGANSFLFEGSGTSVLTSATFSGNTVQNNSPQRGLEVQAHDTANVGTFTVSGNTFIDNGIQASFTQDGSANLTFKFLNNGTAGTPMTGSILQAVNVFSSSQATGGTVVGTISGNFIGNQAVVNSGSTQGGGISATLQGQTDATLLIDGNTIRQTFGDSRGIYVGVRGPANPLAGTLGPNTIVSDITITNNNVIQGNTANNFGAAIVVEADNQTGADNKAPTIRADIRGNTVPTVAARPVNGEFFLANLIYYEYGSAGSRGIGQLVDTAPASADATAQLSSTNTGTSQASAGIALIAGPIGTPPLNAAPGGVQALTPTPGETHLTQAQLDSVVAAAVAQWAAAGASAAQLAMLAALTFTVADLAGTRVGEQTPGHILIDPSAAGHGWFVDSTPNDNSEFTRAANAAGTDLDTDPSNAAAGHLDLLTAVSHEMGHALGLEDKVSPTDAHDLMYINLVDGERRLPDATDVAEASGSAGAQAAEAALPLSAQAAADTPIVVGTAGSDTIDAGHGGAILFGGAGADNFVFGPATPLNAPTPAQVTHVADYDAAEGDSLDFSAITSAFHDSSVSDALVVRAVEDASGKFAMLQVDQIDPTGLPSAPNWVDVAQLDGAHAGDSVNVQIDSYSAVHLAQIDIDWLV
jgi:hypothetical protein